MFWITLAIVLSFEYATRFTMAKFVIRCVLRFFAVLEMTCLKLVQKIFPPKYHVVGDCEMCGRCCKEIIFAPPKWLQGPRTTALFLAYHKWMHNFDPVGRGDAGEIVFACGYLQTDNRCGIHKWRPFLCRNFPIQPWFDVPQILPYCSYQVAAHPVTRMKSHPKLKILNTPVAVHHPSPEDPTTPEHTHYHRVDITHS